MNKEVENEKGFVDRDEQAVSRLLGDLKHVEAPANFERRVMSRIADGERKSHSLFSLPTLALAVGAVVVLLLGSIVFYNMRRPAAQEVVAVQTTVPIFSQQRTESSPQTGAPVPAQQESTAQKLPEQAPSQANTNQQRRLDGKIEQTPKNADIPSTNDYTLRQAKPIFPQGTRPNTARTNVNTSEVMSTDAIPVQVILTTLGVSAEYKNGWLVTALSKNSSGDRSGVKVGDIIDAIGDSQLSAGTSFHGMGRFSTITVRRDGQSLTLKLK